MSFEDARAEANELLDRAAGKRVYTLPRVLSPEEKAAAKARFLDRFKKAA
jgi:hypothetical protein